MIVVLSPEAATVEESLWINSFFKKGLTLFHIRKYDFSDDEMRSYVNKIDEKFRRQLVMHSHHHLAKEFDINRLHMNEKQRIKQTHVVYENYTLSTSVHSIEAFNKLDEIWEYAFLSPVFPSISKASYGKDHTVLYDLKRKNNPWVKLIALGGISPENCREVMANGADGMALLGSVWQSTNPLNTFLQCKQIDQ